MIALISGFMVVFLGDVYADRLGRVPKWWLQLRFPMTLLVVASLGVTLFYLQ